MNNSFSGFDPCGIEVSARTLLVALGREGRAASPREFPNTAEGHQAVLRWLKSRQRPVRIVMESTGLYGLDLALCLDRAGMALMVANPRAARHFAQAMMQRSKTDRLDAEVLRQFAARMPFVAWRPPSAAAFKLVAVARRLEALTEMLAAEKNRLHAASLSEALPAIIRRDIQRSIQTWRTLGALSSCIIKDYDESRGVCTRRGGREKAAVYRFRLRVFRNNYEASPTGRFAAKPVISSLASSG